MWERKGIAPLIPNFGSRWNPAVNFTLRPLYPWDGTPAPTDRESAGAPEVICTFRSR